jgi:hypothetical protein
MIVVLPSIMVVDDVAMGIVELAAYPTVALMQNESMSQVPSIGSDCAHTNGYWTDVWLLDDDWIILVVELPLRETFDEKPTELEVEGMIGLVETDDEPREELDGDWEGVPVDVLTDVEVTPAWPIARNATATTPTTITIAIAAIARREMAARLFVLIRSIDT